MENIFKPGEGRVDSRKRRRFFGLIKRIKRISQVILFWMAGAAVLYGIYTILFVKPYFEVRDIKVQGDLKVISAEQVIEASGIKTGDHLLRIPVGDIQKRLAQNPWISESAVHRKLPHMVWIYVKEHVPEVIVRTDALYYADRAGVLFKKLGPGEDRNLPVITGLEDFTKTASDEEFKSKLVELIRVKDLFETSGMGEIFGLSEIHIDESSGVSIITLNDPMELRLGYGPFMEKIERLKTVYPVVTSHGGVVSYMDLSSAGKVVVKYGT